MPDQTMKPCREAFEKEMLEETGLTSMQSLWLIPPVQKSWDDFQRGWQAAKADQAESVTDQTAKLLDQAYEALKEAKDCIDPSEPRIANAYVNAIRAIRAIDEYRDSLNIENPQDRATTDFDARKRDSNSVDDAKTEDLSVQTLCASEEHAQKTPNLVHENQRGYLEQIGSGRFLELPQAIIDIAERQKHGINAKPQEVRSGEIPLLDKSKMQQQIEVAILLGKGKLSVMSEMIMRIITPYLRTTEPKVSPESLRRNQDIFDMGVRHATESVERKSLLTAIYADIEAETLGNGHPLPTIAIVNSAQSILGSIEPFLAHPEPVSVSLKDCMMALNNATVGNKQFKHQSDIALSHLLVQTKAVLDAAGVTYVD